MSKLSKAKLPKEVRDFLGTVRHAIKLLDAEMAQPPSNERGMRIARICNAMDFAADSLQHFGIKGWPVTREAARKEK